MVPSIYLQWQNEKRRNDIEECYKIISIGVKRCMSCHSIVTRPKENISSIKNATT